MGSFAWQRHVNKTDLLDRPSARPSCSLTCRLWPSSLTLNGYSVKGRDLAALSRTGICRPPVWHPATSISIPTCTHTHTHTHTNTHTRTDGHIYQTIRQISKSLLSATHRPARRIAQCGKRWSKHLKNQIKNISFFTFLRTKRTHAHARTWQVQQSSCTCRPINTLHLMAPWFTATGRWEDIEWTWGVPEQRSLHTNPSGRPELPLQPHTKLWLCANTKLSQLTNNSLHLSGWRRAGTMQTGACGPDLHRLDALKRDARCTWKCKQREAKHLLNSMNYLTPKGGKKTVSCNEWLIMTRVLQDGFCWTVTNNLRLGAHTSLNHNHISSCTQV